MLLALYLWAAPKIFVIVIRALLFGQEVDITTHNFKKDNATTFVIEE